MNTQSPNWQKLQQNRLDPEIFTFRASFIQHIRQFFITRGFLEIEAPQMTPWPTLDSNIESIQVLLMNSPSPFYLHTSPEHAMKKWLASGADKIYFLGKVFRNNELSSLHNPEFTMVEWYRTNATYADIQNDTEALIYDLSSHFHKTELSYQNINLDLTPPWKRISLSELFQEKAQIDLTSCLNKKDLHKAARESRFPCGEDDDWETLFFKIFLDRIEPGLGIPKPVFVYDYPAKLGLMAGKKADHPEWVERTELYIGSLELANGYTELTDAAEQQSRFEEEQSKKMRNGHHYPIDEELLTAMQTGIPSCAGMALGIDRLLMLFLDKSHIEDVIYFPYHQMKRANHTENGQHDKQTQ